ncbi:hypothetical protein NPIL_276821 [Nephila pilipes]|uniref:Uncharacterized protein n=1 Tax=Nephila pilipes TaxID=299642 RepID=A0A8X6U7K9_NEPPI|nr:hypothetical protein NPIL_77201 [Nephila pilipes]GFT89624.1 hypothetical protein NPIL_276821 [Nephila pilipes]
MLFSVGEKLKESVLVQYEKIFGRIESSHFFAKASLLDSRFKNLHLHDKALWGKWIRKLNNKITEEGESSDSDSGNVSSSIFFSSAKRQMSPNWDSRAYSMVVRPFNLSADIPCRIYISDPWKSTTS